MVYRIKIAKLVEVRTVERLSDIPKQIKELSEKMDTFCWLGTEELIVVLEE